MATVNVNTKVGACSTCGLIMPQHFCGLCGVINCELHAVKHVESHVQNAELFRAAAKYGGAKELGLFAVKPDAA